MKKNNPTELNRRLMVGILEPKKDRDETLAVHIRRSYEQKGIMKGWSREQFSRLCQVANLLPEELGALCALTAAQTNKMMREDYFSPPVTLQLLTIYNVLTEAQMGVDWNPVVPLIVRKGA